MGATPQYEEDFTIDEYGHLDISFAGLNQKIKRYREYKNTKKKKNNSSSSERVLALLPPPPLLSLTSSNSSSNSSTAIQKRISDFFDSESSSSGTDESFTSNSLQSSIETYTEENDNLYTYDVNDLNRLMQLAETSIYAHLWIAATIDEKVITVLQQDKQQSEFITTQVRNNTKFYQEVRDKATAEQFQAIVLPDKKRLNRFLENNLKDKKSALINDLKTDAQNIVDKKNVSCSKTLEHFSKLPALSDHLLRNHQQYDLNEEQIQILVASNADLQEQAKQYVVELRKECTTRLYKIKRWFAATESRKKFLERFNIRIPPDEQFIQKLAEASELIPKLKRDSFDFIREKKPLTQEGESSNGSCNVVYKKPLKIASLHKPKILWVRKSLNSTNSLPYDIGTENDAKKWLGENYSLQADEKNKYFILRCLTAIKEAVANELFRFFAGLHQSKGRVYVNEKTLNVHFHTTRYQDVITLSDLNKQNYNKEGAYKEKLGFINNFFGGFLLNLWLGNIDLHGGNIFLSNKTNNNRVDKKERNSYFFDFDQALFLNPPSEDNNIDFNCNDITSLMYVGENAYNKEGQFAPTNWGGSHVYDHNSETTLTNFNKIKEEFAVAWDFKNEQTQPECLREKHEMLFRLMITSDNIVDDIVDKVYQQVESQLENSTTKQALTHATTVIKSILKERKDHMVSEGKKIPAFTEYLQNLCVGDIVKLFKCYQDHQKGGKRYAEFDFYFALECGLRTKWTENNVIQTNALHVIQLIAQHKADTEFLTPFATVPLSKSIIEFQQQLNSQRHTPLQISPSTCSLSQFAVKKYEPVNLSEKENIEPSKKHVQSAHF